MDFELIVPQHYRNPMDRGQDHATKAYVGEQIVGTVGDLAALLKEVCARIQVLEDRAGIVAPLLSPSDASDATVEPECGDRD